MNKKVFFSTFLFVSTLFSMTAQEESSRVLAVDEVQYGQPNQTYNTYKTTWKKNGFKDNWVISIGGGAQMYMGIDDSKGSMKDRVTFVPQFSVAKYFSPIWGLRLNFTGGSLHGFNDGVNGVYSRWNRGSKEYLGHNVINTPGYPSGNIADLGMSMLSWDPQWNHLGFTLDNDDFDKRIVKENGEFKWAPGKDQGRLYMERHRYMLVNFDFMFDFFNLVGNYNPKRFFELTPMLGVGVSNTFAYRGNINTTLITAHAGLMPKFRINDRLSANLEFSLYAVPDEFDGELGDDLTVDFIPQTTLSLAFKLGKTDWEVAEPMDYELINRLNDEINSLKERNAKLAARECPTCPPPPPVVKQEEPAPVEDVKFLPDPVFFRINKSVIDATEWSKIGKAAQYLRTNTTAKVVVTGYADRKTATPAYNMKLSERRSKIVAQALIEKYGIDASRVSVNWSGDNIQPFNVNEWNRVVIFVIER